MKKRLVTLLLQLARATTRWLAKFQAESPPLPNRGTAQNLAIIKSTRGHDMAADPDEIYYSEQYWHWIGRAFDTSGVPASAKAIDLGCGQGRLTMQLARRLPEGQVIGIDMSADAIATAEQNCARSGISNAKFHVAPINDFVRSAPTSEYNIALMTEVSFYYPEWRQDMAEIKRLVRPGGLVVMAFRSQYFDALGLVRAGMLEHVDMLIDQRSGPLFGGDFVHTWQSAGELRKLFEADLGMRVICMTGIGCCSGIADDPHGMICRPSQRAPGDRRDLMRLELALGPELPDCGRYILVIATKAGGQS